MPLDTAAVPERLLDKVYDEELGHDHDEQQEADQYILDRHVDNKGERNTVKVVKVTKKSHSQVVQDIIVR